MTDGMMTNIRKVTVNVCRILLAATFIFSGLVKAVDPLGTQYKIHDYAVAMGIEQFIPDYLTLSAAVLLSALEFTIGILLLFATHRHTVSKIALLVMGIMTPVTLWLAIDDPVSDCGCFGDALKLTNWQTFYKNIVLLAATLTVWKYPQDMPRFISRSNQWIVVNFTILFTLTMSVYCLYDLPMFDFRPYHVGANIPKGMEIPPGAQQPVFDTKVIMEKNGKRKEMTLTEYEKVAEDSTWKYIDTRNVEVVKGYVPSIHDFSIVKTDGTDITDSVLTDKNYTFLLVSPHLEYADDSNIDRINEIYDYAHDNGYAFYCLTASDAKAVSRWTDITGAEYPYCTTDETTLKTIIRSNPGLVLIKGGIIIRKWSHNRLPDMTEMNGRLDKTEMGHIEDNSVTRRITIILLWFVLPLALLTFADRTWAWTKWLKRKRKNINV